MAKEMTTEELAIAQRFLTEHHPFLVELVKLGQKVEYGQSNITIRWHEGKATDILEVINFVRKRMGKEEYSAILDEWVSQIGDGQLNVTLQVKGGKVTDMVNAVGYLRKQY